MPGERFSIGFRTSVTGTTFGELYLWGNAARILETRWAQRPAVVAHLMTESDVRPNDAWPPPIGGPMNRPERAQHLPVSIADAGNLNEKEEESRKIRRLQIMMSMVMSVIGQDPNLTLEEAAELVAGAKRAALNLFPDKELAFDLIYKPRLQRLMRERFRMQ